MFYNTYFYFLCALCELLRGEYELNRWVDFFSIIIIIDKREKNQETLKKWI